MASNFTSQSLSYNLILLGKTGAGISASGNTILGKKSFISKKSFKSVTQEVQVETVTLEKVTFTVYDTPGLFNTETSNENTMRKWSSRLPLGQSDRSLILVVMKATRFTPEEQQAVNLIEEFLPKRLHQNIWLLFTRGDELDREDLTIQRFIGETDGIKSTLQRFQNRYHVFNNVSQNTNLQVSLLVHKIKAEFECHFPQTGFHPDRRIVLLGKTGYGKSAAGNTILGERKFKSRFSAKSVTSKSEAHQSRVEDRNVCVIDTPGLYDASVSPVETAEEIGRSIYLSSPGPHAFLIVLQLGRFTVQERNIVELIELMFGQEVSKYAMILFTHGDELEDETAEELIKENDMLNDLVQKCGGRYHVFNNKDLNNREQVRELLHKIDRMLERNGGTCYSNEMYEEAARLKQEEEEERRREEEEKQQSEEEEKQQREQEEIRLMLRRQMMRLEMMRLEMMRLEMMRLEMMRREMMRREMMRLEIMQRDERQQDGSKCLIM